MNEELVEVVAQALRIDWLKSHPRLMVDGDWEDIGKFAQDGYRRDARAFLLDRESREAALSVKVTSCPECGQVMDIDYGDDEDAPPTPAPAADPSPQPPANPAPPPPPPEAPDAGNVDAMCAGISDMARNFAGVDPSQHRAGWAETQLLEAQPLRELHSREVECMAALEALDDEARERVLTWGVNRWPVARDFVVHVDCMHAPSQVAEAVIDEVARRAEAYTKGAGQ